MPVTKVLTAGIGEADLRDIDVYRAARRLQAVGARGARAQAGRRAGSREKSGLRGRGGAGFPTGRKWSFLAGNDKPLRYLVCNCDEAEPGTFKDHMLLEEAPHLVLEGMLLGAYGIASHHAFIYIRGEFKRGYEIFCDALEEARAAGYVGKNLFGTRLRSRSYGASRRRRVHLRRRDRRCSTRSKASAASRASNRRFRRSRASTACRRSSTTSRRSPISFRFSNAARSGSPRSAPSAARATRSFRFRATCRSPATTRLPLGTTVREIIEIAGGLRPGRTFMAVQPGGGSSACIFEEHLDLAVRLREHGQGRLDARLGRVRRLRRHDRFREGRAQPGALLRARVVRPMHALPRRRQLAGTRARAARAATAAFPATIEMLARVSGTITGLNLCRARRFDRAVSQIGACKRFPEQFEARIAHAQSA